MSGLLEDGKRVAKIYFCRGFERLVKDMAASVRNQRSHAHLIDQQHFTGPDTVLQTNAVLVQASAPKARLIGNTYAKHGLPGIEVLYFDDEGKITQLEVEPVESFASILGGAQTEGSENEQPEDTIERTAPELLGQEKGTDKQADAEAAGLADIEEGSPAENADNSQS